jgi:hypothetical protein
MHALQGLLPKHRNEVIVWRVQCSAVHGGLRQSLHKVYVQPLSDRSELTSVLHNLLGDDTSPEATQWGHLGSRSSGNLPHYFFVYVSLVVCMCGTQCLHYSE